MRKTFTSLLLLLLYQVSNADMISLIRADQCETIIEVFVYDGRIRATLEIGEKDYPHFSSIIPQELLENGFNADNRINRFRDFFNGQFVLEVDGQVLEGEIKRLERIPRNYRASLYTGTVDTVGLTISPYTLLVEIEYKTRRKAKVISITPPIREGYNATLANIGFVTYHKDLPVNDLRYLGQKETLRLDWSDPWYSRFDNRNIARHHKYSLMSFLYVDPYEIRHEVLVRLKDLEDWVQLNYGIDDMIKTVELDSVKTLVAEYLIEKNRVYIDGDEGDPILDKAHFVKVALSGIQILEIPQDMPYSSSIIGVIFAYPHDSIPQQVSVKWDMWNDKVDMIPCVMSDPAGPLPYDLTPDDTELVWNNYLKNYRLPTVSEVQVTNASISFPYITTLMLLIIFTLVYRRLRGISTRWRWGIIVLALIIGFLGFVFWTTIEIPFLKKTSFSKPQARELISELLRNTYRAFDFRSEDDVYDKLAISNEGELLSEIYIETKQSMVLENQGGIQVKLKSIDVLDVEEIPSDDEGLAYQTSWMVEGNVGHWGHVHKRINQYQAIMKIKPVEGVWKMYDLEVLEETRRL